MPNQLTVYYQNVRGLNTKLVEARTFVNVNSFDVISLTETFLHAGVSSSEIFNDNYTVYRNDRDTYAGGSLIAIRNDIISTRVHDFECGTLEDVWIKLRLKDCSLYVCTVYLPPHKPQTVNQIREFFKKLYDNLSQIEENSKILLLGDFNMTYLQWDDSSPDSLTPVGYIGYPLYEEFVEILQCFTLSNVSRVKNRDSRQLDLIVTNVDSHNVSTYPSDQRMCKIDPYHPPIELHFEVETQTLMPPKSYPKYNFKRADYDTLNHEIMSMDWSPLSHLNVNDATNYFYEAILRLIDRNVPRKPDKGKFPIWYTPRLIFVLKQKMRYHAMWKRHRRQHHFQLFRKYRSDQNRLEPRCFLKFIRNVEENVSTRMKEFWQYTKSLRKTNTYPNTFTLADRSETNPQRIADMFADHFSSDFQNAQQSVPSNLTFTPLTTQRLSRVDVVESDVLKILKGLDENKGAGTDGINAIFLKNTATSICIPLALLFQNSLNHGTFPDLLKVTKIHPIFKKGNDSLVSNYRPIAILNTIEKVFERLIHDVVYKFVKPHISSNQHAYQKGRSTLTNLAEHELFLSNALDSKEQVDVLYADMSKAFDLVNHPILLKKLESFGLNGNLLEWFQSYLTDRSVHVTFNGYISKSFIPRSGVPQGSILGPLLFVIFMNDLPDYLDSTCSIFADDVKVCRVVRNIEDAEALESDFMALGEFCATNGLSLNDNKCAVMTYTNKLYDIQYGYKRTTHNGFLSRTSDFKDLGVCFDGKLRFDVHIDTIVKKAFKTLGFVIRTCRKFHNPDTIIYLYNALVRTQLEYASPIWSPYYKEYIVRLERVQRRFTRYLFKKFHIPYLEYDGRLAVLGMQPLVFRRLLNDGVFLYKVINGLVTTTLRNEISIRQNNFNIRNMGLFGIRFCSINCAFYNMLPRTMRLYNQLFGTVNHFTKRIGDFKNLWSRTLISSGLFNFTSLLNAFSITS